jgi:HAMP domain-containing protein
MLENLKIRSKLIALLVLPLAALAVFASSQVISTSHNSKEASGVSDISQAMPALIQVVDAAQMERAITLGYVASGRSKQYRGTMIADRVRTDRATRAFDAEFAKLDLDKYSRGLRAQLISTSARMHQLVNPKAQGYQREALEKGGRVEDIAAYYNQLIGDLLRLHSEIGAETSDRNLARNVVTLASVAQLKEAMSEQQGILFAALVVNHFVGTEYADFTTATGEESAWRKQFGVTASAAQAEFFDNTVKGAAVDRVSAIRDAATAAQGSRQLVSDLRNTPALVGFNGAGDWFSSAKAKIDQLRGVEQKLADEVGALAASVRVSAQNRATVAFFLTVMVLEATVGLSLLMARSMAGPLERLERSARNVAEQQLPGVVERLQRAQEVEQVTVQAEAVPITSRDEIGRVAEAFNSVHQVATQVATEQAALRRSIGDMFINLARRSQRLIDRQLNFIEEMEREESDPDQLAKLFHLDHLATRMRRNAENLIVLSSAETARRSSEPIPLADVIRAAISEVEDFTRVELVTIDEQRVSGHAVNDVVHLLAELIENATTFSPPETPVTIAAQLMPNWHVVEIEDRGLGMTDDQLASANERIANPPMIDFALSRMLGFFVVGRLAQRYGIKVQLRHSWYEGVTALVLIPSSLLVQPGATEMPRADIGEFPRDGRFAPQLPAPSAPAMATVGPGGDLPIFEATRLEWVEGGTPATKHPPLQPNRFESNLPRRTPRANLVPGLATTTPPVAPSAAQPTAQPTPPPAAQPPRRPSGLTRSPEDIRAMLTRYRAGLLNGRMDAVNERRARRGPDPSNPSFRGPDPSNPSFRGPDPSNPLFRGGEHDAPH